MTTVRDGRAAGTGVPDPEAGPVRRRLESWVAGVGIALSLLFMGGFAVVMNNVDEQEFAQTLEPSLAQAGVSSTGADAAVAYETASTLAAWFGFTLLAVLALSAVGLLAARRDPVRRATGWWFAAAGVVCLLGSQLVMFPVAFFFFLTAGLFALRRVDPGSTR